MPRGGYAARTNEDVLTGANAQAEAARRASGEGPSIYEQLWEEMDRTMDSLAADQAAGENVTRLQDYARGLAFAIKLMGPWTYEPTIDAVRAEAQRRWQARHQLVAS